MRTEETRFKIQILISLLTLILTPIFAGIVVNFQLSQKHSFLERQKKIQYGESIINQKIDLLSKTIKLASEISSLIRMVHYETGFNKLEIVLEQKRREKTCKIRRQKNNETKDQNAFTSLRTLAMRSFSAHAELNGTIQTAAFIFGSDTRGAIKTYLNKTDPEELTLPDLKMATVEELLEEIYLTNPSMRFNNRIQKVTQAMGTEIQENIKIFYRTE